MVAGCRLSFVLLAGLDLETSKGGSAERSGRLESRDVDTRCRATTARLWSASGSDTGSWQGVGGGTLWHVQLEEAG